MKRTLIHKSCSVMPKLLNAQSLIWELLLLSQGEKSPSLRSAKFLRLHPYYLRWTRHYRGIAFCLYYCLATSAAAIIPELQEGVNSIQCHLQYLSSFSRAA